MLSKIEHGRTYTHGMYCPVSWLWEGVYLESKQWGFFLQLCMETKTRTVSSVVY